MNHQAAVLKTGLDDWIFDELGKPFVTATGAAQRYNTLIGGRVGSGKTLWVRQVIGLSSALGYAVIVLDVEDEYGSLQPVKVSLPSDLVTVSTMELLLDTDAAYIDLITDFFSAEMAKSNTPEDYAEEHNITGQQLVYFLRAINKIRHLITGGEDLIDATNEHGQVRVLLDPDYGAEQIIILVQQMIQQHERFDPRFRGVMVIIEESERLTRIDRSLSVPTGIFAGRKRNIFFVVVGHTDPEELARTGWGQKTVDQFDNVLVAEGGRIRER